VAMARLDACESMDRNRPLPSPRVIVIFADHLDDEELFAEDLMVLREDPVVVEALLIFAALTNFCRYQSDGGRCQLAGGRCRRGRRTGRCLGCGRGTSRDAFSCSYAIAKMLASSKDSSCCSVTSICKGLPKPIMNNCTCCGSVREISRQERAMNFVCDSLTEPVLHNIASLPIRLSVSGGPNLALMSLMNYDHVGCPLLSSK
jgi:hypothetical protein